MNDFIIERPPAPAKKLINSNKKKGYNIADSRASRGSPYGRPPDPATKLINLFIKKRESTLLTLVQVGVVRTLFSSLF